jgi:hypothetical protein
MLVPAPISVPIARPAVIPAAIRVEADTREMLRVEQARMKANVEAIEQIGEMVRRLPPSDGLKKAEATKAEVHRQAWNSNFEQSLTLQKERIATLQKKQEVALKTDPPRPHFYAPPSRPYGLADSATWLNQTWTGDVEQPENVADLKARLNDARALGDLARRQRVLQGYAAVALEPHFAAVAKHRLLAVLELLNVLVKTSLCTLEEALGVRDMVLYSFAIAPDPRGDALSHRLADVTKALERQLLPVDLAHAVIEELCMSFPGEV